MNSPFLVIFTTYTHLNLVFVHKKIQSVYSENSKRVSKNLLIILNDLLKQHSTTLNECAFIAVNRGPGPYTTLRTVIATVNGLHFATKIPLLAIDSLELFVKEEIDTIYDFCIVLLNAFAQDVYYGIYDTTQKTIATGCTSFNNFIILLQNLSALKNAPRIKFNGNGILLYKTQLQEILGDSFFIAEPFTEYCSLQSFINEAYKKSENILDGFSEQIFPLYLKKTL